MTDAVVGRPCPQNRDEDRFHCHPAMKAEFRASRQPGAGRLLDLLIRSPWNALVAGPCRVPLRLLASTAYPQNPLPWGYEWGYGSRAVRSPGGVQRWPHDRRDGLGGQGPFHNGHVGPHVVPRSTRALPGLARFRPRWAPTAGRWWRDRGVRTARRAATRNRLAGSGPDEATADTLNRPGAQAAQDGLTPRSAYWVKESWAWGSPPSSRALSSPGASVAYGWLMWQKQATSSAAPDARMCSWSTIWLWPPTNGR